MKRIKGLVVAGPYALGATVLVWLGAIACMLVANAAAVRAWGGDAPGAAALPRHLPALAFESRVLTPEEYKALAAALVLPDGVVLKASSDHITVDAKQLVDYENWRLVVDELLLSNRSYRWQVKALCTGACPGVAFTATLEASNETVVLN